MLVLQSRVSHKYTLILGKCDVLIHVGRALTIEFNGAGNWTFMGTAINVKCVALNLFVVRTILYCAYVILIFLTLLVNSTDY